jgi:uncharacterized protein YggE
MSLEIQERDYADTMNRSAVMLDALRTAIASVGHNGKSLKTTSFNIDTKYESYKDKRDTWQRRFEGYVCSHSLVLEFDLDMKLLAATLAAIAECEAKPEFSIRFSVKDRNAISEQLLISAVENATAKARVLAKAAGVELGEILCIDYSWGELRLFSETEVEPRMMACMAADSDVGNIDIEPEDVDVSDSVTVVWSIGGAKCSV